MILGSRFRIDLPTDEWKRFIELMWKPFVVPPGDGLPVATATLEPDPNWKWMLQSDGEILGAGEDRWFLASELRYWLMKRAMENADALLVHAAVVSRSGRALLLMAPSGGGKTTLSIALASAGWTYHGDDLAAFDPGTLAVTALPTPLGIRDTGRWPELSKEWGDISLPAPQSNFLIPAFQLAGVDTASLQVGVLAFVDFRPGAPPAVEAVRTAEAATLCASQMAVRTVKSVTTFTRLCSGAKSVRVRYGSSGEAIELLQAEWRGID